MFRFLKTNFEGDSNVGLYGFATDDYCLIGANLLEKKIEEMRKVLGVDVEVASVFGTELVGLFSAGNKNGIVLTKMAEKREIENLKKVLGLNIDVVESLHTTQGNMILCNDSGCLISPLLKKNLKKIQDILGVETQIGTIAGLDIVGSSAVASNYGCLCHRDATEEEMKLIEDLLKVKIVDVGTVNKGSPYIRAGLIVNSKGVVVSDSCTGPELGRIGEVFEVE